ncbi:MAG: hypothetical protein M3Z16_11480, partial [Pseudomonadota bacterium]|nr:hypothetical protein [Pseudomonadota bacterium]
MITKLSGGQLTAEHLADLGSMLPPEAFAKVETEGLTRFEPNPKEPMVSFSNLPRAVTDCTVLSRLPGRAVLRISESGRILEAKMLSNPDLSVPSSVYECEFQSIPNDG